MKNLFLSVLGAAAIGLASLSLSGCATNHADAAECCEHAQAEGKTCTEPCCAQAMAEHHACMTCVDAGCGAAEDCGGACCEESATGAQNKN